MTANRHREDADQAALFSWARTLRAPIAPDIEPGAFIADYLYAIPNGGKRNAREAARMKKGGVLKGVSDIHLPIERGGFIGCWIELKPIVHRRPPNGGAIRAYYDSKPSAEQRAWLDRMTGAGHLAVVCWGWEAARDTVWSYLHADARGCTQDRPDRRNGGSRT